MDENGFQDFDDTPKQPLPPMPVERQGIPWGAIALGIWALALVIFSVQNAEHATIDFLWWSFNMPVALLVIVTALVTLLLTGIGFAFYRRRKRKEARARNAGSDG
ncbi:MAG TPA: LapA family protein [Acidimicrobiia bacterium]|nr:LapA family protein [Acidimicrobiia bacterium]